VWIIVLFGLSALSNYSSSRETGRYKQNPAIIVFCMCMVSSYDKLKGGAVKACTRSRRNKSQDPDLKLLMWRCVSLVELKWCESSYLDLCFGCMHVWWTSFTVGSTVK
jgi:hypothetical protein